jgi:hypothetical protein
MTFAWWGAALASTWWVDATSALPPGAWKVRTSLDCSAFHDEPLHTLGVAVVVYSRKQGTSAWGHASIRAVGCRDGAPFDVEYESYVFSRANAEEIDRVLQAASVHPDEAYLRGQRGRLFLFRNDDPVDTGFFELSAHANREIYELWLGVTTAEANEMVQTLEGQLHEQMRRVAAQEPLQGRYRALSTNCTVPMQQLLGHAWHLPHRWLRELEDDARLRVVHPSVHLLGRWDTVPVSVERPKPVFRRRREGAALPLDVDALPVLPVEGLWPLESARP